MLEWTDLICLFKCSDLLNCFSHSVHGKAPWALATTGIEDAAIEEGPEKEVDLVGLDLVILESVMSCLKESLCLRLCIIFETDDLLDLCPLRSLVEATLLEVGEISGDPSNNVGTALVKSESDPSKVLVDFLLFFFWPAEGRTDSSAIIVDTELFK